MEGVYCISLQYNHFDTETLMDSETKDKYSLEMIKKRQSRWDYFMISCLSVYLIS